MNISRICRFIELCPTFTSSFESHISNTSTFSTFLTFSFKFMNKLEEFLAADLLLYLLPSRSSSLKSKKRLNTLFCWVYIVNKSTVFIPSSFLMIGSVDTPYSAYSIESVPLNLDDILLLEIDSFFSYFLGITIFCSRSWILADNYRIFYSQVFIFRSF